MLISRDDYRAVKRMHRIEMSAYLEKIYRRGYEAGVNSMIATVKKSDEAKDPASPTVDASVQKPAEDSNG